MSDFKSYRDESRNNWGAAKGDSSSTEKIQLGAILRIADAVEKMAQRYTELLAERDRLDRWHKSSLEEASRLARSNNALRGVIKRMKRAKQDAKG